MKCFGKVNAHGFRFLFIFLLNSLEREAGVTQEAKGSFLPHWQVFLTQCVPGRWRGAAGPGLSCPSGSRRLRFAAGTHKLSESPDRQERQKRVAYISLFALCHAIHSSRQYVQGGDFPLVFNHLWLWVFMGAFMLP